MLNLNLTISHSTPFSFRIHQDGQLVSNNAKADLKTIRSDRITWVDGKEPKCSSIGQLIRQVSLNIFRVIINSSIRFILIRIINCVIPRQVDNVVMQASKMSDNSGLGQYTINGRTKV